MENGYVSTLGIQIFYRFASPVGQSSAPWFSISGDCHMLVARLCHSCPRSFGALGCAGSQARTPRRTAFIVGVFYLHASLFLIALVFA